MCVFRFVMEYHFSNMIGMFCVDMQNILQLISIIEFNNKFYKLLYFIRINTINYYILSCNVESLYQTFSFGVIHLEVRNMYCYSGYHCLNYLSFIRNWRIGDVFFW
jgi:hypothetical protein